MTEETLESLKKENAEMKKELDYIDKDRKWWNLLQSTIFAIFIAIGFGILMLLATVGAGAILTFLPTDAERSLWSPFLSIFLNISGLIGLIYIIWHWFVVVCFTYQKEMKSLGDEIKIYLNAGQKALNEAREKETKKE